MEIDLICWQEDHATWNHVFFVPDAQYLVLLYITCLSGLVFGVSLILTNNAWGMETSIPFLQPPEAFFWA